MIKAYYKIGKCGTGGGEILNKRPKNKLSQSTTVRAGIL